jgi:Tfp pilus assembly protein PilX
MDTKSTLVLRNESGAALVVALLMIVILSLIGLASSSTSTLEIRLSGNKRGTADAFYSADGGPEAVVAKIENFNKSGGYQDITNEATDLPADLQYENTNIAGLTPYEKIDWKRIGPEQVLPTGMSFSTPPTVTIYHTTVAKPARGIGTSATRFEFNNYIINSAGLDQLALSITASNRSRSEIREKVVRLLPID